LSVNAPEENSNPAGEAVETESMLSDSKQESELGSLTREIHDLKRELEQEHQRSSDLANRMRYLQADIVNLQRQADRRVSEVRNQVKLTWLLEIISIKEDLDRAVGVARGSDKESSLLDGLLLVSSRIENILKLEDVKTIPAELGGRFDPNHHEALSYQESETKEHGTILAVISPGYSIEGKVIKPAMVEVAKRKEKKKAAENSKFVGADSKEIEIEEAATKKDQ
jgi:molecular chaperone GrpE